MNEALRASVRERGQWWEHWKSWHPSLLSLACAPLAKTHRSSERARVVWKRAPGRWKKPCANTECTLHRLAPYIGKIKSSIAGELIDQYTSPRDLVADPFAGAGTIPFEAVLRGRRAFGADISPYAQILSKAKLLAPRSLENALDSADEILIEAAEMSEPDLRSIPTWVRRFFHPDTLREALKVAAVCRRPGNEFVMACLLGILHHQRPGFTIHTAGKHSKRTAFLQSHSNCFHTRPP
jgi:hypothetical protein